MFDSLQFTFVVENCISISVETIFVFKQAMYCKRSFPITELFAENVISWQGGTATQKKVHKDQS